MTKRTDSKPRASRVREPAVKMTDPDDSTTRKAAPDAERVPGRPFAEGARDGIDSDLRQRMISEAAYRRFAERGCLEGYDLEDWLNAEAEVDRMLLNSSSH